jgi:hypothetical protein
MIEPILTCRVKTPVRVSHQLCVEILFSRNGQDRRGQPLLKGGPVGTQKFTIARNVIVPSVSEYLMASLTTCTDQVVHVYPGKIKITAICLNIYRSGTSWSILPIMWVPARRSDVQDVPIRKKRSSTP